MADRKSRDVGPSRESSRSSHQDSNRRTREEADKRSSKEKGSNSEKDDIVDKDRTPNQSSDGSHHLPASHDQLEKKLQESLSRFRKHLEKKNTRPPDWQPPDLQIHEHVKKSHSKYLEKFDLAQQSLPKILSDPLRAKNIIEGIEKLAKVDLERVGIPEMYTVINSMHNAIQRLSPNGPEGSSSKGSDTTG